jgi:hypothetical protein
MVYLVEVEEVEGEDDDIAAAGVAPLLLSKTLAAMTKSLYNII